MGTQDPPDLVFSAMAHDDLVEVLHLDGENLSPWSISLFEQHLRAAHNMAYVARRGGQELVAFLCGQLLAKELEIHKIAVLARWRRRGVATALIRHILTIYPGAAVFLELREANSAARNLYETLGFCKCGERKKYYSSPPDDAIIMTLSH